ncbi:MAG: hypothetical protein JSV80_02415 [Acidobacteriota bacterium]|nr:MAG: hypothetical protein JSV80_02415 [Acidobacteriota bacterium]
MAHMLEAQPPRPANMANIVAINQGARPYSMQLPKLGIVPPSTALDLIENGHVVVDTRSQHDYAQGHIPKAFNVDQSNGAFEQIVGWVVPAEQPLLLVASSAEQAAAALNKLAFVGLDQRVVGAIDLRQWRDEGLPTGALAQLSVESLACELTDRSVAVLDVRELAEWRAGHIANAVHLNFKHIPLRLHELPLERNQRVAVICASGRRSSTACSVLRNHGFEHVCNVAGGMIAWHGAGLDVVRP